MSQSDDKTSKDGIEGGGQVGPDLTRATPAHVALTSRPIEDQADAPEPPKADPIESTLLGDGTGAAAKKSSVSPFPEVKPVPKPEPVPEPKSAAKPVVVRKTGFWPVFLGGVVAAGLGAAGAYYAIPHLPAAWQPVPPQPVETAGVDMAALQSEMIGEIDSRIPAAVQPAVQGALAEQQQAQQQALATTAQEAATEAVRQALADLPAGSSATADAAVLSALQDSVAALTARVEAQDQRIAALPEGAAVDPELAAQVQQITALQGQIQQAAADAEQRIAAAQSEATNLQQQTETATRRAQAIGALALLQSAIDSGAPRDRALSDLQAAGVTPPEALSAEIATLSVLREGFAEAARAGLRESLKAESSSETALGVIGNFLKVQTGARSVEPREGTDPDAVLSRANAAVEAGNIASALAEIATLPEPGQQAMAAWVGQAQAYVAAQQAMADLTASIN